MNTVFIISFMVLAIWYTMQDGEIFGKLGNLLYRILPPKLHDPAFDCPVCMTPWYGTLLYWAFLYPTGYVSGDWGAYIISIVSAMGFNVIIVKLWPKSE